MKKRIVFGIIAALALLFVLPGCSDPSNAIPLEKIAGPGNLKATAYEGMNMLTWNPVVDATGYDVYRKDPTTKLDRYLDSTTDFFYKDFVGYNNDLENGKTYEYIVVAKSAKSTANASSGIAVQNGVSRASVKANIPTAEAFTKVEITDAEVTPVLVASSASNSTYKNMLIVTLSNVKPNFDYDISYTYGANTINRSFDDMTPSAGWDTVDAGNNKYVAKFPVLGGDNSIIVTASFGGFDGGYYNDGMVTSKVFHADFVPSLGASPALDATRGEYGVILKFPNLDGADTYEIYKIETKNVATGIVSNIDVIGDWVPVTATQAYSGSNWVVKDETTTTGTGNFLYALIASNKETGARASSVSYKNVVAESIVMPTLAEFALTPYGADADDIRISWPTKPGVEYKLDYAEVKASELNKNAGSSDFILVGDYKNIEIPGTNYSLGYAVVRKTDLTAGRNYIFRLSGTLNGVPTTENQMVYQFLAGPGGAFDATNDVGITATPSTKTGTSYAITLVLTTTVEGSTYKVYRRTTYPVEAATEFTVVREGEFASTATTATITDNVEQKCSYEYRIVGVFGDDDTDTVDSTLLP